MVLLPISPTFFTETFSLQNLRLHLFTVTFFDFAARGDLVGCFALTEPKHGSDPSRMESFAEYDEKNQVYILSGSKMW